MININDFFLSLFCSYINKTGPLYGKKWPPHIYTGVQYMAAQFSSAEQRPLPRFSALNLNPRAPYEYASRLRKVYLFAKRTRIIFLKDSHAPAYAICIYIYHVVGVVCCVIN